MKTDRIFLIASLVMGIMTLLLIIVSSGDITPLGAAGIGAMGLALAMANRATIRSSTEEATA